MKTLYENLHSQERAALSVLLAKQVPGGCFSLVLKGFGLFGASGKGVRQGAPPRWFSGCLVRVLGASWAVFRAFWGVLGVSWGRLGASWGSLGASCGRLEVSQGRLGGVLGRLGGVSGRAGGTRRDVAKTRRGGPARF